MDKHKLILLVSIVLGCIILGVGYYYLTSINNADYQKKNYLLLQKQECQKYINEIEKKLQDKEDKVRAEDIAMSSGVYAEYKLDKIFYSSSRNSCLYVYSFEAFKDDHSQFYKSFELIDYLTGESLELASVTPSEYNWLSFKDDFYTDLVSQYE
ncbi:MAG: hypothetical protein WC473_02910 [Patescibacteria group bacterium]|jgi:hypothetical protein